MKTLAEIAAVWVPMQSPEYARTYRQLWGEPMPYYQPFTAATFPGHDGASVTFERCRCGQPATKRIWGGEPMCGACFDDFEAWVTARRSSGSSEGER